MTMDGVAQAPGAPEEDTWLFVLSGHEPKDLNFFLTHAVTTFIKTIKINAR